MPFVERGMKKKEAQEFLGLGPAKAGPGAAPGATAGGGLTWMSSAKAGAHVAGSAVLVSCVYTLGTPRMSQASNSSLTIAR